ncbi:MAG TPA: CDP-diacylglycerol--serine O-phosphatidyltransferase [Bacteroidales bacterium]|nr:CDP-diacylglycerol--serine O-phosphatidyltransferase [Bacteroidales bacterium]HPJ59574.1 CDP-diacylglycerol--serine O-phosphatidyltransferase [Bacteroidales bacterium]HPR12965.1 CDP-diacylglycerol--serine O-phosphatidyltransferase [Bacteroidales bacterium]
MKKHVPNIITCLNLVSGFLAVIFAAGDMLPAASWLILAAMVFDFFDGFSARLLKAYSETGKELDSLADVVSFGVAPAIIIYKLLTSSAEGETLLNGIDLQDIFLMLTVSLMPVCAALRLAKFNTDTSQTTSFRGLPTPANALAVISLILAQNYSDRQIIDQFVNSRPALILFTLILSVLMVTRIPLLSLKTSTLKLSGNEGRYVLILAVIITIALFGLAAAVLIIPVYILISLTDALFRRKN